MTTITIDLGTTICKVQAFDEDGREVCQCSKEIETYHPKPDWAEQDPMTWWQSVREGFKRCSRDLKGEEVVAIGICSHRESILAVDGKGNVIFPCILWADRRCRNEARILDAEFGSEIHQKTGMKPDPYFTAPKLLWLKEKRPEIMDDVGKFLLPKDYIVQKLTGSYKTDWSVASRTMMLDIRRKEWWSEMLEFIGVEEDQMCPPMDSAVVVREITPAAQRELGLDNRPRVVAGAGDRQCEALGSGVSFNKAMESTGSATNLSISSKELPKTLPEGLLYSCHAFPNQYLVEQGIGSTGLALRWFRDTFHPPSGWEDFRSDPYGFIDKAASASVPGAKGLTFLPFLMGAQATRWNPNARGGFFGLNLGHTYGDLARSVLEGIAFEIRASIEVLNREGITPNTILALGGSAKSRVWNRIKADVTGRTYSKPRVSGAASLGAMILANRGVGIKVADPERLNPVEARFTPDPSNKPLYEEAFVRYEKLYEAFATVFSR